MNSFLKNGLKHKLPKTLPGEIFAKTVAVHTNEIHSFHTHPVELILARQDHLSQIKRKKVMQKFSCQCPKKDI